MPEIAILVYNCGGKNKNNVMVRFLNMIKEGGLFGTYTLHFYIKGHTKNDCDRSFKSLKVLELKVPYFWKVLLNFEYQKYCWSYSNVPWKIFNSESFLNDICNRPDSETVNINHVFWVKNSWHTLVIVKSYIARHILNIIIKRTMPTVVHRGTE